MKTKLKKKCDSCWKAPLCNLRLQADYDKKNCYHYANFENVKHQEGYA